MKFNAIASNKENAFPLFNKYFFFLDPSISGKSSLLNNYRYNKEYESSQNREIRLLIIKREGTENVNIIIEDNNMQVY